MVRKYYRKPRTKSYITYDDLEQLGFGSWLKKNAGAVGTVLGATVGTLIAPGVGTALGASIGGSLGGAVSANEADKEATEAQNKMVAAQNAQAAAQAEFQRQQNSLSIKTFPPVMANGGDITKPKPEEPEDKNLLNPKLWGQRYDSIELDTLPKATIIGDYVDGNYRVIVSPKNKDELNLKDKKPVVVREAENIPVYKVKQGKRVYYVPTQDAALTHALPSQIKYNNVINYLGTKYRISFPEVAEVINTLAKKYIDKFGYDEFITNKKEDFLRDVDALFSSNDKAVLLGNNAVLNKEDAAQLFKDNNLSDEDVKTLMGTLKTKGRGADDKDNESLYEFGYRTYANSLFRKPMSLGPIVLDSYNPYDDSERLLASSYYLNHFYPPYLAMNPVDVGESTDSNDFTKQYRLSPNSTRKTKSYDETHFMPNFSADDIINLGIPFKTNSAISGLVVNNDVRAAFPDYYANDSEKGTVVNYLNNKINEQFKSIPRNQMDLNSSINHPKDVELFKTRIELLREYKKQGYTYSTAKNDFENSYKAYQNGGEITKSNPVIYNNIQPQEVPSSTRVSTKNPQFELELLNRNLLKQDLLQKSSQGDTEAELQFRDVFGTSTHRYRYDNDPNYKQQVDQELKNWKGDKINYPSDSPFRQDAVPYNMRWMYPQLTDESQKVMGDFSNEVISSVLPIPLVESIGKMPSVFKISDKVDDIIKYYHGGLGDEIKTIDDIDLFRTAIKQNKKGRDYSGFYLYDAAQKEGAATYAKQTGRNLHEFDIAKNSKIKELSNIERVTKEDLQKYIDEGYDMITGIDVRGRREYILLNKEKVKNMKSIPYPQRAFGGQINLEDEMQNTMRNTGVINYSGQTHEGPDEGIPVDAMGNPSQVSQQEPAALVEDGEVAYIMPGNGTYVFSDKLKYDGKKTFADKAKEIQRKYKLRMKDGKIVDPISEVGYNKEMTRLVEAQEAFREVSGVNKEEAIKEQFAEMGLPIENNTLPIGKDGIYIKPSKRGTFTAAAKKHGMGVQEFARHVLANKENYSASMVKKANFARNAAKWKHEYGGFADSGLPKYGDGSMMNTTIGLGEAFLPAAASTIGNMWLMNQIKNRKVEKLKYTPMVAKQIDLSAERNATTENLRAMEAQNRRNALLTGSSAGQINQNSLLGTLQTERALAEALSKSYGNEAQFNATAQNQINAINAENQLKADMANLEMQQRRDEILNTLRSQIASAWAQGATTYLQGKRDFTALNAQANNYKLENKGNWFFSDIQRTPINTNSTTYKTDIPNYLGMINMTGVGLLGEPYFAGIPNRTRTFTPRYGNY